MKKNPQKYYGSVFDFFDKKGFKSAYQNDFFKDFCHHKNKLHFKI